MRWSRRIFFVAGLYGLAILLPQYLLETKIGRDFPPAITHPEFFYGFLGVAIAWQVAFLIVATDPMRFRPLMIPAILEKLSFGLAALALYQQGRLASAMLFAGMVDLLLAFLFVLAFRWTRPG